MDAESAPYVLRERHAVALFEPGDEGHNVIVLSRVDVVIPIEMDLDGDPQQDDMVSLGSVHGLYEHVLRVGDEDVGPDPDRRIALYHFRHVPPGLYRVAVRIGAAWVQLGSQLSIRREGVFWNGVRLSESAPDVTAATEMPNSLDTAS